MKPRLSQIVPEGTAGQYPKVNATEDGWDYDTPSGGGGGSGFNPSPIDDPANFGTDLGFDYEFGATSSSLPTGWSWVNQGSATYSELYGGGVVDHPGASGDDVKGIVRSLSGAPSSWLSTGKFYTTAENSNYVVGGIVLRESSSGKLLLFGYRTGQTIAADKWNSPTSYNSGVTSALGSLQEARYLRVRKNSSTSWDFEFSASGRGWRPFASGHNLSTFMTPDQIGVGILRNGTSRALVTCDWLRLR